MPLIAKGDAVLDWREISAHSPGAQGRLPKGRGHDQGNHAEVLDSALVAPGLPK